MNPSLSASASEDTIFVWKHETCESITVVSDSVCWNFDTGDDVGSHRNWARCKVSAWLGDDLIVPSSRKVLINCRVDYGSNLQFLIRNVSLIKSKPYADWCPRYQLLGTHRRCPGFSWGGRVGVLSRIGLSRTWWPSRRWRVRDIRNPRGIWIKGSVN